EDLNAPLLGTAEASVPSAQTQAQAPGKWEQVKKGWNELSTAKKVGIGVGSSIGLGLFIFFMVFFLGRKKPVSDGIIIQNQRENTTIYDGEIAYPINATYLSGHDQTVSAVLLFAYASLQSLSSNFTLRFADRETLVNAQNFNGSFSVPFGSLAEANSAFNQTQAIGAGNQEAALDLSVYAVDAKNRTTETIKTHTHYIPGPPPVLPLIISGEQNASLAQGQSYRPFGQFAVQNLGDAEANSAHLGMQLISSGQSSCQLTVNGQTTLIAVNSSFPRSLSTINLKGAIDLTSTMQGLQTGCSGDNATIYTQVFDTAGTRNDSNVLTSAGSYRVPPSPGPSPTPSPTPTPVPQCDGVSVLAAKQVSTLSNKPFYPLTGVQFASTNSSKPIADVQGAWGYCYNVNPAYNFFVDRQCDQNFPENTVDSQYNRCCQTTQGLSYSTAEGLYAQAGFQLQSGVKMGQTRVINGTFQPDQPGCPTSNTGIMAKITPIYMLQAEAEAVDLEQDVRPA
ncbi:MAG: hypothetical protein K0S29_794, partial [Gammaproteobacteria bacterium]|nr:hypothetical protein [Gammaproteobacteria bacterium]